MNVCPICEKKMSLYYTGPIRNGVVGNYIEGKIYLCKECDLQALDEYLKHPISFYDIGYREFVGETIEGFKELHDKEQPGKLQALYDLGITVRDKSVLDVGCGGGSFLDLISNMVSSCQGVDPSYKISGVPYVKNGMISNSLDQIHGKFDLIVSFLTIEHVSNPVSFLESLREKLSENGFMVISTPDLYFGTRYEGNKKNYYRTQHNYYFHRDSLRRIFKKSGFEFYGSICNFRKDHKVADNYICGKVKQS
jgi:SAM-dependent methyltransferase